MQTQADAIPTPAWVVQFNFAKDKRYETRNGMTRGRAIRFEEQGGEKYVILACSIPNGQGRTREVPVNVLELK